MEHPSQRLERRAAAAQGRWSGNPNCEVLHDGGAVSSAEAPSSCTPADESLKNDADVQFGGEKNYTAGLSF